MGPCTPLGDEKLFVLIFNVKKICRVLTTFENVHLKYTHVHTPIQMSKYATDYFARWREWSIAISLSTMCWICTDHHFSQANVRIATKLAHDGLQVSMHPGCAQGQGQRSRDTGTFVLARNSLLEDYWDTWNYSLFVSSLQSTISCISKQFARWQHDCGRSLLSMIALFRLWAVVVVVVVVTAVVIVVRGRRPLVVVGVATWRGISIDVRIFEISNRIVTSVFHSIRNEYNYSKFSNTYHHQFLTYFSASEVIRHAGAI